jgi:hypothetical protein
VLVNIDTTLVLASYLFLILGCCLFYTKLGRFCCMMGWFIIDMLIGVNWAVLNFDRDECDKWAKLIVSILIKDLIRLYWALN